MKDLALQLIELPPQKGRMAIAVLLSITVHVLLLLIHFSPIQANNQKNTLAVTLVNSSSQIAPLNAQALAQSNLDGGGNAKQGIASSPVPHTTNIETQTRVLMALRKRQSQLEQQQIRLLSKLQAINSVNIENPDANLSGQNEISGEDNINQESQIINSQIAAIKEQIKAYNALPRKTFIAPSTQAADFAQYVEAWRVRIETIGTRHYPPEARGKTYGDLQLTVFIRKDGQLDHIVFDRPAKQAILNSAAKRIIELAQPFEPLPKDIAKDTDILAITRTWHFTKDGLDTN